MSHIPVTLITGFLGAGKTTLLNRLLNDFHGRRVAVVVNEFGDVGIDDQILPEDTGATVTLSNGAICCAALGDTANALVQLLELRHATPSSQEGAGGSPGLERVFIETTGLADPFPLVKAFLNRPSLAKAYALDSIVTVADAFHLEGQLAETKEAAEQLAAADIVLLNKTDLVSTDALRKLETVIRKYNEHVRIVRTVRSEVPLDVLFAPNATGRAYERAVGFSQDRHGHNPAVMSVALKSTKPLALEKVSRWVAETLLLNGDKLMRYKGILHIAGKEERFVFQGVHHHFETLPDRPWKEGESRQSDVILIGRDLDRTLFERTFAACVAEQGT